MNYETSVVAAGGYSYWEMWISLGGVAGFSYSVSSTVTAFILSSERFDSWVEGGSARAAWYDEGTQTQHLFRPPHAGEWVLVIMNRNDHAVRVRLSLEIRKHSRFGSPF